MKSQIKKAIIPVAGLGTRFLPATKAQPKEMLPIVDKPVIQYLVEEAVASGIEQIIFVTGRNKRAIEDHFDHMGELEQALVSKGKHQLAKEMRNIASLASFIYIRQKEPNGPGDALLQARHLIGDEPVAVLYGDDLVRAATPCLRQLIDVYATYQAPVLSLYRVGKKEVALYGIVKGKKITNRVWKIDGIIEKPTVDEAPSRLASIGKYIYTPELFAALPNMQPGPNGELFPTDVINAYAHNGGAVYGCEFEGTRYDCGDKLGFMQATVNYGLTHPEIGVAFRKYLRTIKG